MISWLDIPTDHPYTVHHLPYGIFTPAGGGAPRPGVRIGDAVLDLSGLAGPTPWSQALSSPTLNALLDLGPQTWASVRTWAQTLLTDVDRRPEVEAQLHPVQGVRLHLPFTVADYVDFYASEHHASNVGRLFRPDSDPLTPNWKHLPVGYHGRSGTVLVSGTPVRRPHGQRRPPGQDAPVFGPSARLDLEAEVGFVIGGATPVGRPVPVHRAEQHLFGLVLLNDWSARDIQAWEYVPLGPFLGKSFATSIAAWVTPLAALERARVPVPGQDPVPLPYLRGDLTPGAVDPVWGLDLHLEVEVNGTVVARPRYRDMYWSPTQMLAHLTVNGASLRTGDLFGSGTVSGPGEDERGSLLELSWNGTRPVQLPGGRRLTFLEDGDTVTLRGWAPGPEGSRIGLAEVAGTVLG